MRDLTGKVALVTGASSGIGEATARLLVSRGVRVVLAARREERLAAIARELGDAATPIVADVTDAAQVERMFAQVRDAFGGLDLLFNNAGLGVYGSFADSLPNDWRAMIDANLLGLLSCTHAAIPLMRGRPGAMIAAVSSTGGRYGFAGWSVYCATKYAVVGFHEALRKELGEQGIRVTTIEPGAVWTDFGQNLAPEALRARRESLDALTPDDIAQALVYAFAQHPRVLVQEMLIRPVKQIDP